MLQHSKSLLKTINHLSSFSLTTQAPYVKLHRPLNIAHRGLSSIIPQNTIPAFEAALYLGADFIELDVVMTKDDQLLVMHDPYLSRITNVEQTALAGTKAERYYDSEQRVINDGWTDQFTLEELRTLRVRQNQAKDRITSLDWHFGFSTLDEVIEMVKRFNKLHQGRRHPQDRIGGICVEVKDGDMYRKVYGDKKASIGKLALEVLKRHEIDTWQKSISNLCPVYLNSFDVQTLKEWHEHGSNIPRNLLIEQTTHPKDLTILQYIHQASKYAHGVGIQSTFVWDTFNRVPKYDVLSKIREMQMLIHLWTFKDDDRIFGAKDYIELYHIGHNLMRLDGIITEFSDVYVPVSHFFEKERQQK